MRYFYTDPLAAAWMAKYFGMVFSEPYFVYPSIQERGYIYTLSGLVDQDAQPVKIPIHSTSMHLLVPSPGDTVDLVDPFQKIIQRNGTPFIWPEFEE